MSRKPKGNVGKGVNAAIKRRGLSLHGVTERTRQWKLRVLDEEGEGTLPFPGLMHTHDRSSPGDRKK